MAIQKLKTRERIILTSLDLFNLEGEANVTTVDIANELDISPGNLYYHFRGKELIIEELYGQFEERITRILRAPLESSLQAQDSWFYLYVIFEELYAFRFLYRNLIEIVERIDKIGSRFKRLMALKREVATSMCVDLRKKGLMSATDQEISSVADTTVVLLTFWLNYVDLGDANDDAGVIIHRGVYQIMSAVSPYLKTSQIELYEDYQQFVANLP